MPDSGPTVRQARPEERLAAADLTASAYQQYEDEFGPRWERYVEGLRRSVETADALHLIAEVEGKMAGSVLLFWPGVNPYPRQPDQPAPAIMQPEVRLLAVAPGARGMGIGEALMRETCALALAQGFSEIRLHTVAFMTAARRLYERLGFVRFPEADMRSPAGWIAEGYRLLLSPD